MEMTTANECVYLTREIVGMVGHPMLKNDYQLRKFLREFRIIVGNQPNSSVFSKGYIDVDYRERAKRGCVKEYYTVLVVSPKGVKFIKELADLIL